MKKLLNKKKVVVLFDIDHTLFNTVAFVNNVYKEHSSHIDRETFDKVLEEIRINLEEILNEGDTVRKNIANSLWNHANSEKNFYKETEVVLKEISKVAEIGIFSKGDERFQKEKIKSISHHLKNDYIHVTLNKYKTLPDLVKKYKTNKLVVVDDILEVLYFAKRASEDVFTVWIRREAYHEKHLLHQELIEGFSPDATMSNLKKLISIIKKMEG